MIFLIIFVLAIIYSVLYVLALLLLDCDVQTGFYERFGKSVGNLKGKVVFITGASSGIGESLALELAKHGAKLVLTARRGNELNRVKRQCLEISKGGLTENDVLVLPMDITDLSIQEKNFNYAVEYFGKIDILVNNAGRSQRASFENIEINVDKKMFELNTFAVVNLTRIAVRHFTTRGGGQVAVVSSLAGIVAVPFSATYDGTKHAIHGYFNALRFEKARKNIAVTIICPGPTFSNFLSECFTDKDNVKYGKSVQPTDLRMTSERCARLCAVALVNKLNETWAGIFPVMLFTYVVVYFPTIFNIILKIVGPEKVFKLRDTQELELREEKHE